MGKKGQTGKMMQKALSWMQKRKRFLILGGIVLLIFILAGILFGWDWIGFTNVSKVTITSSKGEYMATITQPGKSFLDVIAIVTIPVVVVIVAAWFSKQQAEVSQRATTDSRRETLLQEYLNKMSELILVYLDSKSHQRVSKIVKARTLTVLRRLDGERKGSVIQFLLDSGLIKLDEDNMSIEDADLEGVYLQKFTPLMHANLYRTHLEKAMLVDVLLFGANLSYAKLQGANLHGATLVDADLSHAKLIGADLSLAFLYGAKLQDADLSDANLRDAQLIDPNNKISDADLSGANLDRADFTNAKVTDAQLKNAKSHKGTIKSDGSKFP